MHDSDYILKELEELGAGVLVTAGNKNHFSVPGGYFDVLPANVMAHVFVQSLPISNPYSVPAGYFENLTGIVLDKIKITNNGSFIKENVYSIPDGYFNNLADNVLKKIKAPDYNSVQQELEEIAPLLSKIPKTNVYAVPENYFDDINLLAITANKKQVKVVSFGSKTRKWINYAAAACVVAVLAGGGYFYFNKPVTVTPPLADVQKQIDGLTDAQIADYLNSNNSMAVYTSADDDDQKDMDVQSLLQNVSDEEIQQYLNQDTESAKDGEGI